MNPALPFLGAAAVALSVYLGTQNAYFAPDACDRIDAALRRSHVGQPLATRLLVENICAHLRERYPQKPLILSLHGPPGVGKTYSHYIMAQAMYGHIGGQDTNARWMMRTIHDVKRASEGYVPFVKQAGAFSEKVLGNPLKCPGDGCPAYKVIYGMDYINLDRKHQHYLIRESILQHARTYPESLIVIEEYDKLHCDTRSMLRQILLHPEAANVTMGRSIILMEANQGMFPIQQMLMDAGRRELVIAYHAHNKLKDHMHGIWVKANCETKLDAAKFGNLIDMYIPFFHMERQHIRELIEMGLKQSQELLPKGKLTWKPSFVEYYVKQVPFDGAYAVDGAIDAQQAQKEVSELLRTKQDDAIADNCADKNLRFYVSVEKDKAQLVTYCLST